MLNLTDYAHLAEHEMHVEDLDPLALPRFRDVWLPTVVDAETFAAIRNMPMQYLVALYPRLFVQGPNAKSLERVVQQVITLLTDARVDPEEKTRFCQQLWHTYRQRWGQLETVGEWDALHEECARLGLGGAMIQGTYLTKLDVDALLPHVKLHMIRVVGKAAASVQDAVTVFTQMVLIRDLIDIEDLTCEQVVYDEDGMEGSEYDDEYAEGVTVIASLESATVIFQQHDLFMREWGLG